MINCVNNDDVDEASKARFFANTAAIGFYEQHDGSAEKGLEPLVFRVSRGTRLMEAHIERIYYCYQNALSEQLYGALIDMLLVLNRNGAVLATRMVSGAKSKLAANQLHGLVCYLEDKEVDINTLPHSKYAVLAKGLLSTAQLVELREDIGKPAHDPLQLARDCIEYSQIDDAIFILEQAILSEPEREELFHELLSLYRHTQNATQFNRIYGLLSQLSSNLPSE
jgi:hypothetical protein